MLKYLHPTKKTFMNNDTLNKMQELFNAQKAKTAQKVQPIKKAIEQPNKAIKPPVIVETIQEPELSTFSIDTILQDVAKGNEADEVQIFSPSKFIPVNEFEGLKIVDYSERSFAVIGETKPHKELLRNLGGSFNFRLSCGAGWIFSKSKLDSVKNALQIS